MSSLRADNRPQQRCAADRLSLSEYPELPQAAPPPAATQKKKQTSPGSQIINFASNSTRPLAEQIKKLQGELDALQHEKQMRETELGTLQQHLQESLEENDEMGIKNVQLANELNNEQRISATCRATAQQLRDENAILRNELDQCKQQLASQGPNHNHNAILNRFRDKQLYDLAMLRHDLDSASTSNVSMVNNNDAFLSLFINKLLEVNGYDGLTRFTQNHSMGASSAIRVAFEAARQLHPEAHLSIGFHGVQSGDPQVFTSICCEGFDPEKRKGQKFGPGEYFGGRPSTALQYDGTGGNVIVAVLLDTRSSMARYRVQGGDEYIVVDNPVDRSMTYALPIGVLSKPGARAIPLCGQHSHCAPTAQLPTRW